MIFTISGNISADTQSNCMKHFGVSVHFLLDNMYIYS